MELARVCPSFVDAFEMFASNNHSGLLGVDSI